MTVTTGGRPSAGWCRAARPGPRRSATGHRTSSDAAKRFDCARSWSASKSAPRWCCCCRRFAAAERRAADRRRSRFPLRERDHVPGRPADEPIHGAGRPRVRFIDGVVESLAQVPGVSAAASGAYSPMGSMRATRRFAIRRQTAAGAGHRTARDRSARRARPMPRVMGLRVIDGRWITDRDRADSPPVVVISESFAKQHFAGRARGRPAAALLQRPADRRRRRRRRRLSASYRTCGSSAWPSAKRRRCMCRTRSARGRSRASSCATAGDPRSVMGSLPAAVHAVDPDRPLERVRTLDELISDSTADRRALSGLLLMAAVVALLISDDRRLWRDRGDDRRAAARARHSRGDRRRSRRPDARWSSGRA